MAYESRIETATKRGKSFYYAAAQEFVAPRLPNVMNGTLLSIVSIACDPSGIVAASVSLDDEWDGADSFENISAEDFLRDLLSVSTAAQWGIAKMFFPDAFLLGQFNDNAYDAISMTLRPYPREQLRINQASRLQIIEKAQRQSYDILRAEPDAFVSSLLALKATLDPLPPQTELAHTIINTRQPLRMPPPGPL